MNVSLNDFNDFYGFPSTPRSIYHTGPAWPLPRGPQAQRTQKEARPVLDHAIRAVWPELGRRILEHFDATGIKWTSIDPVRFQVARARAGEGEGPGPLFLWVGVLPGTLARDGAAVAAQRCKDILAEYAVLDVEIAFRESVYTRYAGPQLLQLIDYTSLDYPTADVRSPFTAALGVRIARRDIPNCEGTGCVFLREGGNSDRIFLLTARHVVLPTDQHSNTLYRRLDDSARRLEVIHLGDKAYRDAVEAVQHRLSQESYMIEYYKGQLGRTGSLAEVDEHDSTTVRLNQESDLAKSMWSKAGLERLHATVSTSQWEDRSQRVLGHVLYSPPIDIAVSEDNRRFTEDWAVIELDRGKVDWQTFRGNVIHLGTKYTPAELMEKMYPHPRTRARFRFPEDGLMRLREFVKDASELRSPEMLDADGDECLIVIKNGTSTGLTFGRASGIESFVREYDSKLNADDEDGVLSTAMALAVYAYRHSPERDAFSEPGDSGAVVADASGRIVGMLTAGAGKAELTDVSYVTPYWFLEERIKRVFPDSQLYTVDAA